MQLCSAASSALEFPYVTGGRAACLSLWRNRRYNVVPGEIRSPELRSHPSSHIGHSYIFKKYGEHHYYAIIMRPGEIEIITCMYQRYNGRSLKVRSL